MRYIIPILFVSALMFSSCKDDPVTSIKPSNPWNEGVSGEFFEGLEISFHDTCSYKFAVNFVNSLDSAEIIQTYMGTVFTFESNYYTVEYWKNYFYEDPAVRNVSCFDRGSSIRIYVYTYGKESFEEEKRKFKSNEEITLIRSESEDNHILVHIPEINVQEIVEKISRYPFIESVSILVSMAESTK